MVRLHLYEDGTLALGKDGVPRIDRSPVGILVRGGIAYSPESAGAKGEDWIVRYSCGDCAFRAEEKDRYWKLTVTAVPEGSDGFIFGPYGTGAENYGEVLGAGWYGDGSAVCIQSLMPKVEEGNGLVIAENRTGIPLPEFSAAARKEGDGVILSCFVKDRSHSVLAPNEFGLPSAQERCPRRTGSKGSAFALRHLVQRGCPRDSPASQSALINVGFAHI